MLVRSLEPNTLIDRLYADDVLSVEEREELAGITTKAAQNRYLLRLLSMKPNTIYDNFIKILTTIRREDIVHLLQTQWTPPQDCSDLPKNDSDSTSEIGLYT